MTPEDDDIDAREHDTYRGLSWLGGAALAAVLITIMALTSR